MGRPDRIDRVVPGSSDDAAEQRLFAVVTPHTDGSFDAHVVDGAGVVHVALRGYRTVELPAPVAAEQIAPLPAVAGGAAWGPNSRASRRVELPAPVAAEQIAPLQAVAG